MKEGRRQNEIKDVEMGKEMSVNVRRAGKREEETLIVMTGQWIGRHKEKRCFLHFKKRRNSFNN